MELKEYIEHMKIIHNNLLNYIDDENNEEENFENFNRNIKDQNIKENRHDLKIIFYMIISISNNHHRSPRFFKKIEHILLQFKNEMTTYYLNDELFRLFKSNKRILLFLFEEKLINPDRIIYDEMKTPYFTKKKYLEYFLPEFVEFINDEINKKPTYIEHSQEGDFYNNICLQMQKYSNESIDVFNAKRRSGENSRYLSRIIQQDSIQEFIKYVHTKYQPNSYIEPSIFETNEFLLERERTTLIEYAAFFGAHQIFKHLFNSKVVLTDTIWIFAIHGNNEEIIQFLENHISNTDYNESYSASNPEEVTEIKTLLFEKCINEAIKCHHNHIINYIEKISKISATKKQHALFKFYNFSYFPKKITTKEFLVYACKYDYYSIVKFFFNTQKINTKELIIKIIIFYETG